LRAAVLIAAVVMFVPPGGAPQAAVREVESMPGFPQLVAAAQSAPPGRREHEQRALAMVQRGEDVAALAYVQSLAVREPRLAALLHEAIAGAYARDRRLYRATQHLDAIPAAVRSDQAWYLSGHIAARQQRLQAALDAFGRVAARLPQDPLVARDEAQIASLLGQVGRTSSAAERLLRLRPGEVEATVLLARTRVQQGRIAEAGRLLAEASRRDPRNGRIVLHLGLVELALGKPEAARLSLVRARSLDPGNAAPYVAVAALELFAGNPAVARESTSGALRINPADPLAAAVSLLALDGRWPAPEPGGVRFVAANLLPDMETEPLVEPVRAELSSPAGRGRVAALLALSELLSPHAALHWLAGEGGLAVQPLFELATARAELAAGQGRAAEQRVHALVRDGAAQGMVGPAVFLAAAAAQRNDPGGARAALDRGLAVAPRSPRMHMLAGDLRLVLREPASAIPHYRSALGHWPRDPRLLNQLAHALAQVGTPAERRDALQLAETALAQRPHYLLRAALLDTRADLLWRLGRKTEALTAYRELSTTVGGMTRPEQWHRLGDLALEAGDVPGSLRAYEEALDYGRDYAGRLEAVRRLDSTPGVPQK